MFASNTLTRTSTLNEMLSLIHLHTQTQSMLERRAGEHELPNSSCELSLVSQDRQRGQRVNEGQRNTCGALENEAGSPTSVSALIFTLSVPELPQ